MLGWALVINNLGRRRYPTYWWAPGQTFVSAKKVEQEKKLQRELRDTEIGLAAAEGGVFEPNGTNGTGSGSRTQSDG